MENGHRKFVDFPMKNMVDLSMAKCDSSPEDIHHETRIKSPSLGHHATDFWWENIATQYVKRVKRENIRTAGDDQQNSFDL